MVWLVHRSTVSHKACHHRAKCAEISGISHFSATYQQHFTICVAIGPFNIYMLRIGVLIFFFFDSSAIASHKKTHELCFIRYNSGCVRFVSHENQQLHIKGAVTLKNLV